MLKKYEQFVENASISTNIKLIMKKDIRKVRQRCSKISHDNHNRGGAGQSSIPNSYVIQQNSAVSAQKSSFQPHAFVLIPSYQSNPSEKLNNRAAGNPNDNINIKEEAFILIFKKHIKLCKKMIQSKNLEEASLVISAIQKILEQVFLPHADLRWKILKIRAIIVRAQVIFGKLSLENISKSGGKTLSKKQVCFMQRLPLFCKQIEKDALFSFLEKDIYAFIEVLYFLSAKYLTYVLSRRHSLSKKRKAEILCLVEKGKLCLLKQLEDLNAKLVKTEDKKIFDITTRKSEALMNFYGLELALIVVTQMFEGFTHHERMVFSLNIEKIFEDAGSQSSKQHWHKDITEIHSKISSVKMRIWESYEVMARKIPNCVEMQPLECAIRNAFLSSVEQIRSEELKEGNYEGSHYSISKSNRSRFSAGPASRDRRRAYSGNESSEMEKKNKENFDFNYHGGVSKTNERQIVADQAALQFESHELVNFPEEDKIRCNVYVAVDPISSQSTISPKKGEQKDCHSSNLFLSPYVIQINEQGQNIKRLSSDYKSHSHLKYSSLGQDEPKSKENKNEYWKKLTAPRPSILIQNKQQNSKAQPSLISKQPRLCTSLTKKQLKAPQKRSISASKQENYEMEKRYQKLDNLRIFRLAKSTSKLSVKNQNSPSVKEVEDANLREKPQILRSLSWAMEKGTRPNASGGKKNGAVFLPFLMKDHVL